MKKIFIIFIILLFQTNIAKAANDAAGYEIDKAVVVTVKTDDALTAGDGVLVMHWIQKANDAN